MSEKTPAAPNTQKDYLAWYKETVRKSGLKDIKFFPGDTSQATVDLFIRESQAIDAAIANKQTSPLPDNL